jgi:hypothetical protein
MCRSCLNQNVDLHIHYSHFTALRHVFNAFIFSYFSNDGSKPDYAYSKFDLMRVSVDCLCGLVVRAPGCKPRGSGFDSRRYQIFCMSVGLERGPPSLVSINEELLERKSSGSGLEN